MEATLKRTWTTASSAEARPGAARVAVAGLFFLNGILFATWVSRIPAIQEQHAMGHGTLGLALLAVALGAVVAMPVTGMLCARFGSHTVCKNATLLFCAALPAVVLAPNTALFVIALFCFGASHGTLDVAMNAQAVAVEKRYQAAIMSSFHALFSLGGLLGAGAGAIAASRGLPPGVHFTFVAATLGGAGLLLFPHLLESAEATPALRSNRSTSRFPLPNRGLLALGVIALCTMMGEGAMADWTAVYLRNNLCSSESVAAAGYTAFSLAMAVGRFGGDYVSAKINAVTLVRLSGLLAAAGLLLALAANDIIVALIGFGCVGAGFATIVPTVFSAAGRTPGVTPGVAIASVTTLGYLGFLTGPPLIGLAAEVIGLPIAFGIIIGTSLLAALLARSLRSTPGDDS